MIRPSLHIPRTRDCWQVNLTYLSACSPDLLAIRLKVRESDPTNNSNEQTSRIKRVFQARIRKKT